MNETQIPTPQQVKAARVVAGLTQRACAERFGYRLRGWQQKEETGPSARALSVGEWNFLMLLGDQHPTWTMPRKVAELRENHDE